MATKVYEARIRDKQGKEVNATVTLTGYGGTEPQAEYQRLHPDVTVLSFEEKGELALNDEHRLMGQIQNGKVPAPPSHTSGLSVTPHGEAPGKPSPNAPAPLTPAPRNV